MGVDPRFVSVRLVRDLEKPSSQDIARLLAEPTNIELWTEVLPPDAFEFDGMTVITAVDVTLHEVISRLKNDLIEKDSMASPEKIDRLQHRLRNLLRLPGAHPRPDRLRPARRRRRDRGSEGGGQQPTPLRRVRPDLPEPSRLPAMREFSRARTRSSFKTCRRRNYAPATNTTCGNTGTVVFFSTRSTSETNWSGSWSSPRPSPGDLNAFNARRLWWMSYRSSPLHSSAT